LFDKPAETAAEADTPVANEEPSVKVTTPPVLEVKPPEGVIPGQNSVGKALPKSWKKDMAPHWEKLPAEVHDYVYAREADVMRGIQQYQQGYQSWDTLIKPFAPLLQEHPDVNPIQLMQGLMNTHLQLLDPATPAAKKSELARNILESYGLTLDGSQPNQEVAELRSQLRSLQQNFQSREQQVKDAELNKLVAEIDAFAKDPKNEYFNEVGDDIQRFIQTGAALDIRSAYDLAIWANPGVRAKMLAKQQVTPPPTPPRKTNGQFVNLEATETSTKPRKGSIDSTIDSIVAKHYSAH